MLTSFYLIEFYIILTDPADQTVEVGRVWANTCIADKVSCDDEAPLPIVD